MRFIAFGDLVANQKVLRRIVNMNLSSYDFAIFTGDIPNPEVFKKLSKQMVLAGLGDLGGRKNIARETEPEEALRQIEEEFREAKILFSELNKKIRIVGVWGNADHVKMINKVPLDDHIEIIHNRVVRSGDFYLLGYSGRPLYIFEKENRDQRAFTEDEIYTDLDMLFRQLKDKKLILVTHDPPYKILDQVVEEYREYGVGTYGERARNGHIGSVGLRKIVDRYKPMLHVCSHIHECKGVLVKETIFINNGSVGEDEEIAEVSIDSEGTTVIFRKV